MSDSEDEQYIYSDEEDGDGDAFMAESPSAKKARDETHPARVEDGQYVLMGADDVAKMMLAKVKQISELLDVPRDCAEVLLREKGWSPERLTEQYWADGEKLRKAAGLETWTWPDGERSSVTLPQASGTVTCRICFDEVPADKARAAPCGHSFCDECYAGYLDNAVQEGAGCVLAPCPEQECATSVPLKLWEQLLDQERFERLRRFRLENFVTSSKDLRWCPGAGCDKIVRSGAACTSVKCTVANGGCGAAFCVRCGEEAHQPAGCPALAEWAEKCQNESETANWILANTKRCPKCQTRIEKNQGCNHMSCSQCKYEFCWMCMGELSASFFGVSARVSLGDRVQNASRRWRGGLDDAPRRRRRDRMNLTQHRRLGRARRDDRRLLQVQPLRPVQGQRGRPERHGQGQARARPLPPLLQALPRPRPGPEVRDEAARGDGEAHDGAAGDDVRVVDRRPVPQGGQRDGH